MDPNQNSAEPQQPNQEPVASPPDNAIQPSVLSQQPPQQPAAPQVITPAVPVVAQIPESEQTTTPAVAIPVIPPQVINQPTGPATQTLTKDPGRVLAIISICILFLLGPLIGLILAIVAFRISKKAGFKNKIAKVSIWANLVLIVINIILLGLLTVLLFLPNMNARTVALNFSDSVRAGDCTKAITYTTTAESELDDAQKYCEQTKASFGTSQNEIASKAKDGKHYYLYTIEDGTSKYLRLEVESGKVMNVTVSDTVIGL